MPEDLLIRWREELRLFARDDTELEQALSKRIAKYEDKGCGECHLRRPRIARLVENALLFFDGERYNLLEWCVMPNHVHALISTIEGHSIRGILHSWKSYTANEANRILLREGTFWMVNYHDRFIRDGRHYDAAVAYIRNNPVKAKLCASPELWLYGSARVRNQ